jgi:two-component system, NarL family, invasion response regulator UvrY
MAGNVGRTRRETVVSPRILVVDDHAAIRRGLQATLADVIQGAEFGEATDAQQALDQLRKSHWDIAVLDLSLPGRGGLDLIRNLKDEQPSLRILVYSVHAEDQFGFRAIRAGADGYVTKDQPLEEISKAILTILKGERYVSGDLAQLLMAGVKGEHPDHQHFLSDREIQVLRMLAAGKSPSEIGNELALSGKTVSTYRARVLEKLGLRNNADLVRYAIEHKIV